MYLCELMLYDFFYKYILFDYKFLQLAFKCVTLYVYYVGPRIKIY